MNSDPTPEPAMTDEERTLDDYEMVDGLIGAVAVMAFTQKPDYPDKAVAKRSADRVEEYRADLIHELARLRGEVTRLRAENATLLSNEGMGGCSADAPEEMELMGMDRHGGDRWIHPVRTAYWQGKLVERQAKGVADGSYTEPVKYVRADVAERRRAPAPIDQAREQP